MLKRSLILHTLALVQAGCYISEESGGYKPFSLTTNERESLERLKREALQLEDLKIGGGPVAALGRKVSADIEVRYAAGDGKPIYRGPAISYFGMEGSVFIHNDVAENGILSVQQRGIMLGLNGMTVGGKRRITIHPKLVCEESGAEEADPKTSCILLRRDLKDGGITKVHKETLIVEATLTASCIPIFMEIPFIYKGQFRCRDSDIPRHDPSYPIWRAH
jgi:hypothetical protein